MMMIERTMTAMARARTAGWAKRVSRVAGPGEPENLKEIACKKNYMNADSIISAFI